MPSIMKRSPPLIAFVFMLIASLLQLIWREGHSFYLFVLSQIFNLMAFVIIMIYMARKSPPLKRIQFIIIAIVVAILPASMLGVFVFGNSIDRLIHSMGIYNNFLPWVIAALLLVCLVWFIIASLKPKTK